MMAARIAKTAAEAPLWLARLPLALTVTRTPRARRVAFVGACAIAAAIAAGGVALHRPVALALGLFLGATIISARFITEPQFARCEALSLWPPPSTSKEPLA